VAVSKREKGRGEGDGGGGGIMNPPKPDATRPGWSPLNGPSSVLRRSAKELAVSLIARQLHKGTDGLRPSRIFKVSQTVPRPLARYLCL